MAVVFSITNVTNPARNPVFDHGDTYRLSITGGPPNTQFDLNLDGVFQIAFGTTDGSGNFSQTGTFAGGFYGVHTEFIRVPTLTGGNSNSVTFLVSQNIAAQLGLQLAINNLAEEARNPDFGVADQYLLTLSGAQAAASVNLNINGVWHLAYGTTDANGNFSALKNFSAPADVLTRAFTVYALIVGTDGTSQTSNTIQYRVIDASTAQSTALTGADLLDLVKKRLAGYANAVSPDTLMSYLNEGKDEVWTIIKALVDDYFETRTQSNDRSQVNFFPMLVSTTRDYALPEDFREMRFIECVTPGFEDLAFKMMEVTDSDWRDIRRGATSQQGDGSNVGPIPRPGYHFVVTGKNTLTFAEFPEQTLEVVIWYIQRLLDFEAITPVPDILLPYTKKIADFAAKKTMLAVADPAQFEAWRKEWASDIISITQGAGPRNQSDAKFVEDFEG